MIIITWGTPVSPVVLQWGELAGTTGSPPSNIPTPNPIAVMIATSGTAAPVNWAQRDW